NPGFVLVAEITEEGELTGSAMEVEVEEGDRLWEVGYHVTYGTWKAFEDDLRAQEIWKLEEVI
ncbi:MAG: hypothetical protein HYV54_00805, partial [Parcubacteria group bacterium]|nr:hypothetical protein [Parcubacteria group bacterium]